VPDLCSFCSRFVLVLCQICALFFARFVLVLCQICALFFARFVLNLCSICARFVLVLCLFCARFVLDLWKVENELGAIKEASDKLIFIKDGPGMGKSSDLTKLEIDLRGH